MKQDISLSYDGVGAFVANTETEATVHKDTLKKNYQSSLLL